MPSRLYHHIDHCCQRPILNHIWSIAGGIEGCHVVRVACRHAPEWDYYNVYYVIPVDAGSRQNAGVRRLCTCPSFSGEIVVFRQTEDGRRILHMRGVDQVKAELAITA